LAVSLTVVLSAPAWALPTPSVIGALWMVGARIGSVSGDTKAGALIGGGMGLSHDYL
jgi:hypothetical protein